MSSGPSSNSVASVDSKRQPWTSVQSGLLIIGVGDVMICINRTGDIAGNVVALVNYMQMLLMFIKFVEILFLLLVGIMRLSPVNI